MELVFLQGAQVDVQAVFEFYGGPDTRRSELFLRRLDRSLALLRDNPKLAPPYAGRFRRLILRGFAHAVFYSVTGERIFISAVLDLRQDPSRLRQRLGLDESKR